MPIFFLYSRVCPFSPLVEEKQEKKFLSSFCAATVSMYMWETIVLTLIWKKFKHIIAKLSA